MRPVHLLLLAVVLALLGLFVALSLRTEVPDALAGTPRGPVAPRADATEAAGSAELVAPEVVEVETNVIVERPVEPAPAADAIVQPDTLDRSLAGAVDWLRKALPERFGELTVAQAAALEELDLRGVTLTDADLQRLSAFPNLKLLGLRGTAVTDQGLAYLHGLPLQSLDLRGTAVTGSGMYALPTSTLTALHLTDTKVTTAELARMPVMPQLATLKLNRLTLTDDAIEALSIHPALKHVEMDGTALTEGGLKRLFELHPNLARLEIRGTGLSAAAIDEARRAHPGCAIVNQ